LGCSGCGCSQLIGVSHALASDLMATQHDLRDSKCKPQLHGICVRAVKDLRMAGRNTFCTSIECYSYKIISGAVYSAVVVLLWT